MTPTFHAYSRDSYVEKLPQDYPAAVMLSPRNQSFHLWAASNRGAGCGSCLVMYQPIHQYVHDCIHEDRWDVSMYLCLRLLVCPCMHVCKRCLSLMVVSVCVCMHACNFTSARVFPKASGPPYTWAPVLGIIKLGGSKHRALPHLLKRSCRAFVCYS